MPGVVKSLTAVSGIITAATGGLVDLADLVNIAASKLLGRGDSGAGPAQEITLGTGLSMTGTTLNVSGLPAGFSGSALVIANVLCLSDRTRFVVEDWTFSNGVVTAKNPGTDIECLCCGAPPPPPPPGGYSGVLVGGTGEGGEDTGASEVGVLVGGTGDQDPGGGPSTVGVLVGGTGDGGDSPTTVGVLVGGTGE